ncbi:MAG: hypothetical protein AB8F78_06190 [Saprospiraceae bacterium]
MKNSTTAATTTLTGGRLLGGLVWELSLLGHKTIDIVRLILTPGGWFRSLPHVRILLVLGMVALISNEDISFSLRLGDSDAALTSTQTVSTAANAGFFSDRASLLGSMFSSSAFAKTSLTHMDSRTGVALIDRFKSTAAKEQESLGVDAGVLLAAAIAAAVVETPDQVDNLAFTTNYFGSALEGTYPTAWASWRAMSLAVAASTAELSQPTRDDFVRAASNEFADSEAAQKRIYEALRFYQL